ncbi:NUDIX hydrolase, partial [Gemmiger formicilis]|nr:NUDIX hydrolase [Gemmiger formicilis]
MPEMLDIVDENGLPTGRAVPRTQAQAEGLRHRTSHVWILRKIQGRVQVLLQMRCAGKD